MAILTGVSGLEVYICVDGKPRPEYRHPQGAQSEKAVVKYIETEPGMEFTIVFRHHFNRPIRVHKAIDGEHLEANLYDTFPWPPRFYEISRRVGECDGKLQIEAPRFSLLEISSDTDQVDVTGLGSIVLRFEFVKNVTRVSAHAQPKQATNIGLIPETSIKGQWISQRVSYEPHPDQTLPIILKADPAEAQPFATFTFLYRTMAELKMLGVVPVDYEPPNSAPETTIGRDSSRSATENQSNTGLETSLETIIRSPQRSIPSTVTREEHVSDSGSSLDRTADRQQVLSNLSETRACIPEAPRRLVDSDHEPDSANPRRLKREAAGHGRHSSGSSDIAAGKLKKKYRQDRDDSD